MNIFFEKKEIEVMQCLVEWNFDEGPYEGDENAWEDALFSLGRKLAKAQMRQRENRPRNSRAAVRRRRGQELSASIKMSRVVMTPVGEEVFACSCGAVLPRKDGLISGPNPYTPPQCKKCFGPIKPGAVFITESFARSALTKAVASE